MLMLLTMLAVAAQSSQTLAEIAHGKLQCYIPDPVAKSCDSIAGYERRADGSWDNTADQLMPNDPTVRMKTLSEVTIDGDTICGPFRREDLVASDFFKGERKLTAAEAAPYVQYLDRTVGVMFGHQICTRYRSDGSSITAEISMDGQRVPQADLKISWIAPSDGYRLRSRQGPGAAQ